MLEDVGAVASRGDGLGKCLTGLDLRVVAGRELICRDIVSSKSILDLDAADVFILSRLTVVAGVGVGEFAEYR